jgi:hypothetical protein
MPLATTADLILAGTQDIQQELHNPYLGLHFPPSHVTALKQQKNVLAFSKISNNDDPVLPLSHKPLRVETSTPPVVTSLKANHPAQRVVPLATVPLASSDSSTHTVHFAPTPSTTMKPT